ncbi:hypothetical protein GUJ93_ZPchr0006g43010 [Zizania palustris]|uniref:Spt5 transcription elongation factor N-terminal domain-containing protein n=1 Tax=Zizania palustris TaxID=103762 RepID=A0A8J5T2U4_ZIZPA|nr:hypothetical protein GUJ93_ZPchr0006g43010 [Zizania palustris]
MPMRDEEEDIDEIERQVRERYARSSHIEYGEETAEVEQQALLPSVKDPKLWMVKCAVAAIEVSLTAQGQHQQLLNDGLIRQNVLCNKGDLP